MNFGLSHFLRDCPNHSTNKGRVPGFLVFTGNLCMCVFVCETSSRNLLMDLTQFCDYFSGQLNLFFFDEQIICLYSSALL